MGATVSDIRYQVFVSSTFADLQQERREVIQTLMKMSCIPAGMELFPASDEAQLEFIKRVIDECDYYLLIIGGRYGSVTAEGVSYTEKEYDYALERGLRVVALLHESPDDLPVRKSEIDPTARERLAAFRERVKTGRLVEFWRDSGDLQGKVALSMLNTIKQFPAVGWMRANRGASEDLLSEINNLRKEKDRLEAALAANLPSVGPIPDLAGLDDTFTARGIDSGWLPPKALTSMRTWRQVFFDIVPYLKSHPHENRAKELIQNCFFPGLPKVAMNDQDFQTVAVQFQALDLIEVQYAPTVGKGMGTFWNATPRGERLGLELRAIRKPSTQAPVQSGGG